MVVDEIARGRSQSTCLNLVSVIWIFYIFFSFKWLISFRGLYYKTFAAVIFVIS
jgi:hypothetical protein